MNNNNLRGARWRPGTGGATSAASIKNRVGFNNTHKVRVENGKLISWWECLRSIDEAADKCIALYQIKKQHS